MVNFQPKKFDIFFSDENYLALKNQLYNYQIRKEVINRAIKNDHISFVLEIGSGISPIVTRSIRIIYTDISFSAVNSLRSYLKKGWYVVADASRLPFKKNAFSHAICSEVLEHIKNDEIAVQEMANVLMPKGKLLLTIPHQNFYFSIDDRYVNHYRRYVLSEFSFILDKNGFIIEEIKKILGPLEKILMIMMILFFIINQKIRVIRMGKKSKNIQSLTVFYRTINRLITKICKLDAWLFPRYLATILFISCALKKGMK